MTSTDGGQVLPFSVNLTIQILIIRHIMVLTRILVLVQLVFCSPSVQVDLIFLEIQLVEDTTHQFTQVMRVELKDLVVLVLEPLDLMMIRELTVTRALLPYFGRGTINVTGIGFLRHLAIKSMMM